MDERELEQIAGRLGREAGERLDVDGVARAVVARLRTADEAVVVAVRPRPLMRWLATAAAVALVAGGSVVTFRAGNPGVASPDVVATDLYDLTAVELAEVLDSLGAGGPISSHVSVSLDDLDAEQLEALLAMMEG